MRRAVVVLSVLVVIALLGLSTANAAEEQWVVKDGVLIKESIQWHSAEERKHPFWNSWIECAGKTVDGLFVVRRTVDGKKNHSRFVASKSAVGDCEFTVVFSYQGSTAPTKFPGIVLGQRGVMRFSGDGRSVRMVLVKVAAPIEHFTASCPTSVYDGKLHTIVVKRVGEKLSFHCDGKQLNEQTTDANANLHIWFDSLLADTKIKTIHLTAEKLINRLEPDFKSAAPVEELFVGTGGPSREYGKAAAYRIPALAISKKGTILAFCEARRFDGRDIGDNDAVVKRSEDNGKTWGPEILIWDDGANSINNPTPVVDPKTGRIWLFLGHWRGGAATQHLTYSDDDGKTWSKLKEMTKILREQFKPGRNICMPGPGAGIVLERGKNAGRLVIPMNYTVGAPDWKAGVVYSDDGGASWKPGGCLLTSVLGEARCAELCDGSVMFNGRTGKKKRCLAILGDGGTQDTKEAWFADDLPDPGCQGAIVRHSWPKDGKPGILLYSGPASLTARAHGTLCASYDDGKTWPWKKEYYEGGSGYSDIAVLADGRVAILFEKDTKSKLGFMIVTTPPAEPPAK